MMVGMTVLCLFTGSLMFSYWIGRLLNVNIRQVGDGNPGGSNLWKATGLKFGLLGIALDFCKGYIPLLLVLHTGIVSGNQLIPISLAPIVGHAFSPFLKFNGGKSLAVTFGVWSALTTFRVSICFAIILAVFYVLVRKLKRGQKVMSHEDGFQATLGFLLVGIYLFVGNFPSAFLWIWIGNLSLLVWKNKSGIVQTVKETMRANDDRPML